MDGDPAVEAELDAFSRTLPLPYRVALIIAFGIWGWGVNLQYLYRQKIDVPSLIRYPGRASPTQPPHHRSVFRLATAASTVVGLSLLLFWALTRRDAARVLDYDWLPMATLILLGVLLVVPLPAFATTTAAATTTRRTVSVSSSPALLVLSPLWSLPRDGRRRFAATLRRVALGGLAEPAQGKFGDILLADVLTSYAKVLADLFVCVCMFFFTSRAGREASATDRPDRNCGGAVIVPLIMAAPYMARFRQCLTEYLRVRRAPYRESVGWGGQHLANAGKYASSFPVILFSALQRAASARAASAGPQEQAQGAAAAASATVLYRLWIVAVLVNSLYSFYWDVTKDWDLTLFAPARVRNAPDHAYGLRRRLYIQPAPLVYYAAILVDLLLRCTWSLKLSPHLDHIADFESSLFLIQALEVFRRWIWIFFRVETEWIRSNASLGSGVIGSGPGVDDVLLGDYGGKYDDDEDDDIVAGDNVGGGGSGSGGVTNSSSGRSSNY